VAHAGVRIRTDKGEYEGDKVLVTVPVSVMGDIAYVPPIPTEIKAAGTIGFGNVIKILMRFRTKWWAGIREQKFEKFFFMFSEEVIPTWWTQYPEPHSTLTGWVAGPAAHNLRTKTDEELEELALQSLSNIFGIAIDVLKTELLSWKTIDWENDPLARGAYSYATPETEDALEVLGRPVLQKLYFAGEHFGGYSQATVEGALASGRDTARFMMN
jgi:monoamine oxidase